eukprot:1551372-Pyramimonas_sp.AAC.1
MMFRQRGFSEAAQRLLLDRALQHRQKNAWQRDLLYASRSGCPWAAHGTLLPRRPCRRELDL